LNGSSDEAATEYSLIENSFQFQEAVGGVRILRAGGTVTRGLLTYKGKNCQISTDESELRHRGQTKRQAPSIVADPTQ
jgi:hypothetical protein